MKTAAIYDPNTGEILRNVFVENSDAADQCTGDEEAILVEEFVSDEEFYVLDGTVVSRPSFDIPDTLTVIAGMSQSFEVPIGTVMTFQGEDLVIDDGLLEIEADVVNEYEITLKLWPYITKTVRITTGFYLNETPTD